MIELAVSKVHKCPGPLLFAHKATTIFQMLNLTCYTFWPLAFPQGMIQGQV